MYGLFLTDDSLMKFVLHTKQFLLLAFQHPVHRYSGPSGHHISDIFRRNGLCDDRILHSCLSGGKFIYLLLGFSHLAVTEFRYLSIITGPLCGLRLNLVVLHLLAGCLDAGKNTFLLIPLLHQNVTFRVKFLQLVIDLVKFQ